MKLSKVQTSIFITWSLHLANTHLYLLDNNFLWSHLLIKFASEAVLNRAEYSESVTPPVDSCRERYEVMIYLCMPCTQDSTIIGSLAPRSFSIPATRSMRCY